MTTFAPIAIRSATGYMPRNATEIVMRVDTLSFYDRCFSQPEAVRLTRPNLATLDNWLRYDHVPTFRDDDGRRIFSFADLLLIDCIEMLTVLFKMPPKLAAEFGRRAVKQYQDGFAQDAADIARGVPWSAASRDLDGHFNFAREGESVVEVEPGDNRPDATMLILPTRMIARRVLAAIRDEMGEG